MHDIIFEHLKKDVTLTRKENQTTTINIDFWKTRRNNLKTLAYNFQVVIHIHPGHPQAKTLLLTVSVH